MVPRQQAKPKNAMKDTVKRIKLLFPNSALIPIFILNFSTGARATLDGGVSGLSLKKNWKKRKTGPIIKV